MPLAAVAATSTGPIATTGPATVPLAVSVVGIVLLVVLLVVVLLAVTGFVAGRRRADAHIDEVLARVRAANNALAAAHAADEGWDRAHLETAAREAAAARGLDPSGVELVLVEVDDRPGVDDDRATFQIVDGDRREQLVLGRVDGRWTAV
ncbi:hypothetical protein SK069_15695 [Patulibacter brassicae]|jgi:hypothetical protein|uniref:Uncharacterized protein n=1 Tax=Patulibacter brassicae TaxID=1705717 RepID=A0ABU4VMG4_9ACTN|nr:hypothetical protein [Patulibacter brassicae]MDX8153042.1 hypothetical protein [Patulibacter brassicae]